MSHVCVRIYPNGSAKYTVRDASGMQNWLEYNRRFRPGNTLIVDGAVVPDTGSLSGARLAAIVSFVLDFELPDPKLRTPTVREWDDEAREHFYRYPDDSLLVSDWMGANFAEELGGSKSRRTDSANKP